MKLVEIMHNLKLFFLVKFSWVNISSVCVRNPC